MERVIGIDLGTTFSAVAWVNPDTGKAEVLRDPDTQEATTPSVVMFDTTETVIVGRFAKDNAIAEPAKIVEFVKRQMGKPKGDPPEGFQFVAADRAYTAQEVSALILKRLKTIAEVRLGVPVDRAVITVPAYFDEPKRSATKEAGQIAGLEVMDILDEPVAAALAYGLDKVQKDQTVFVFDLGGGTFDVTILRIENRNIRELAIDGDARLGGKDWDDKIIEHCARLFAEEFNSDPLDDLSAYQDLQQRAIRAKHELTQRPKVTIVVNHAGSAKSIPFTRDEFEGLCSDLVSNCRDLSERALQEAKLTWPEIDTVLLVGGSTRMPMIRQLVREISGKEPVTDELNPDECVAQGAAWKAVMGQVQTDKAAAADWQHANPEVTNVIKGLKVSRIISHHLGAVAHETGPGSPLKSFLMLKKGTPLPARATDHFQTIFDGQETVEMPVTQDGYYADGRLSNREDCTDLGVIRLSPLPPGTPAGTPIEVSYEFGDDGILRVTATEMRTGIKVQVEIDHPGGMSQAEMGLAKAHLDSLGLSS